MVEKTKGDLTMKRLLVFLIVCCIVQLHSQPKLSVNSMELYLGKIMSGETTKGKIILKNIGTDTLILYSVKPTCGCTTLKEPKSKLKPNEVDSIEIEFHSAGYSGNVIRYVNIASNDPTAQSISIKLIVDVEEIFKTETRFYWLGELKPNNSVDRVITLTNSTNQPITIKNIITSVPHLSVKWKKATVRSQEQYTISVTLTALSTGFRNEYVWIETDHPRQQRYEIKFSYIGKE